MRHFLTVIAPACGLLALTACAPTVPDSAAGVGFGDPVGYMARQQAQTAPTVLVPPRQVVSLPPQSQPLTVPLGGVAQPASPPAAAPSEAQSIASAALASVRPEGGGQAAFQPVPAAPPPPPAVWTPGNSNVTAYALATTHGVGMSRHSRSRLTLQNTERNCAGFASADLAQEEFLRRGGPDSDPLNIDPDGDGFACGWSPEPFRAAARAAD